MDINDVHRLMDYRSHFDGMDSDLSPCSRDSNETTSSSSPPQSVTLSPGTFLQLGIMDCAQMLEEPFPNSFAFSEPCLRVVEQPVEIFRFRYLSETTGVHGAITGRTHSKTNKTYPAVQLLNWSRLAHIRCSLFTGQSDETERTPSCHQLVVKGAQENKGTHIKTVNDGITGDIASFDRMAIINTSNKDKLTELRSKLQIRMLEEKQRTDGPRAHLTLIEKDRIEQEAKKQAKDANLSNTASLLFECFDEEMLPICSVFSGIISNQKNALTNELKISRIDKHASSCLGKEEVFMLVEKVNKKHIQVRFFEVDDDDTEVWYDYATFTELDVHHQFAIVFKTPPYRRLDIAHAVNVFVELRRPIDNQHSEPIKFQYHPCEKQASRLRKKPRRDSFQEASSSTDPMNGSEPMPSSSTDPMLTNGFTEEAFVSNTQSIEAVINAPLLTEAALAALYFDEVPDFTWVNLDVETDSAGTAQGRKHSSRVSAEAKERDQVVVNGDELLREVMQGCSETKLRRNAINEILESFRRLCSQRTEEGNTAVHLIVDNEDLASLKTLTEEMATLRCSDLLNVANDSGETALHLATCLNAPDMAAILLVGGASSAPTNQEGRTAAHLAAELGHDACLAVLLDATQRPGDWIQTRDKHGLTVLHVAVIRGNLDAVRKLCSAGAEPGVPGRNGETALHAACQEQQIEIVRFLVEEMAVDVDIEDIAGKTAMDVAMATGCQDVIQILTTAGGRPTAAADSSCESDSDADFEDAESGSEMELNVSKVENSDSVSSLSEAVMQRLCSFLDSAARWKSLAAELDFAFLIGGIDAENVGSPGKTLVNFADMNGVGVDKLRASLTKISSPENLADIFDS